MRKLMLLMLIPLIGGCGDGPVIDDPDSNGEVLTYKVAVFSKPEHREWMMQTINWAQSILERAQVNQKRVVKLQFEWMDQSPGLIDVAMDRVEQGDYMAILGPSEPEQAKQILGSPGLKGRTIILPMVGSADLQRIYANWDNVFFMTRNDVMQNEILLNLAHQDLGVNQLALVAAGDGYGQTFTDYFGFQAVEMGSAVRNIDLLGKDLTVAQAVENYRLRHKDAYMKGIEVDSEALTFFFPSSSKDLLELDRVLAQMEEKEWESFADSKFWAQYTVCSDRCVDYDIASQVKHRFFGVEPAPLPESGFAAAYESKYGRFPKNGTAQTFDAVYLLTYALSVMDLNKDTDPANLCKYVVEVLDGKDANPAGWQAADAEQVLNMLKRGLRPCIKGVSSAWEFDQRFHHAPLNTTYRYWMLNGGKYETIAYVSANGANGGLSSIDIWNLAKPTITEITDATEDIKYKDLKDNYAVIVAASTSWENYRHQADALAMYQLLKRHGYDDEHIILIMEDDIAQNPKNPHKGEVRVEIGGENLYKNVKTDYKLHDLTYEDLISIVSGKRSDRLPVVLPSGDQDNILFFWSGHGNSGTLYMGDSKFPANGVKRMLNTMNAEGRYRRLFFVIEACYSGSVASVCEGIPGVLFMTAANATESSKADIIDKELNAYLSNGFTRGFQQKIDVEPEVNMRDLYYHVAGQTVGSHANLYNIASFGSVYKTSMKEFMPE
ncbi:MAG: hypothetical protein HUJ94_08380 [Bacteroidales bacterium]|nr:hypothetical protein [Bacteroidales bacterium]